MLCDFELTRDSIFTCSWDLSSSMEYWTGFWGQWSSMQTVLSVDTNNSSQFESRRIYPQSQDIPKQPAHHVLGKIQPTSSASCLTTLKQPTNSSILQYPRLQRQQEGSAEIQVIFTTNCSLLPPQGEKQPCSAIDHAIDEQHPTQRHVGLNSVNWP